MKWLIYFGVQAGWCLLRYVFDEIDAFWFGAGEVMLFTVLIIMAMAAWTEETWGRGV